MEKRKSSTLRGEADQIVELIVKNTNSIAYFTKDASTGLISLVVDNSQHDATSLAAIIETITGVGTDTIVEVADQLTFK